MLHVFSTNLVKLVARTPKTTIILGRREYVLSAFSKIFWRDGIPPQQKFWKQNTFPIHKYTTVGIVYTRTYSTDPCPKP